jgi:cell division protein ZapE
MAGMLEKIYQGFIEGNGLEKDQNQIELIKLFDKFKVELEEHKNDKHFFQKIFQKISSRQPLEKCGIYICGDVGRGKSMLMEMFFNNLQVKNKKRTHFHQFMIDFHQSLHKYREDNKDSINKSDPVVELASNIANEFDVLCLDELQINNIADAMIVGRLFKTLLESGTFIVVTSNRRPQELFKDGLQRERFLPFIELIDEKLMTFYLNSFKDYRLDKVLSMHKVYFYPINKETANLLNGVIDSLTGQNSLVSKEIFVDAGRHMLLHRTYGNIAVFTFNELCQVPLGAIDYIALANNFNTIIIENIPQLGPDNHNEALRFITLIDCLYENRTNLICSAGVQVEQLYIGNKNKFEFNRTISRLKEMQSLEYMVLASEKAEARLLKNK